MGLLKKATVFLVCCALTLSGCVANKGYRLGPPVGPSPSSSFEQTGTSGRPAALARPRLDVVIPVFDPGLSEKGTDYAKQGVWPELRRAEANRFAHKLKLALEETNAFGAVRVTPDATATGDLYVMGKIQQSSGETVAIDLEVRDISGTHWFDQSFRHTVASGFHKGIRNTGKDSYDPVFRNAAHYLVEQLNQRQTTSLERMKMLTDLRFGVSLTEEAFSEHLRVESGQFVLSSYPSDDDPMLLRTKAVRVRDQMFVDDLQDHYRMFSDKMDASYLVWQEQSLAEVEAEREARRKAIFQGIGGALLLGLGIAALGMAGPYDTGTVLAGTAAGVAGGVMLGNSFQTSKEAKVHRDALNELGESIDFELAPQVVAFEKDTQKLTGTAKEQFGQWRAFLKKIYEQERTPEVDL